MSRSRSEELPDRAERIGERVIHDHAVGGRAIGCDAAGNQRDEQPEEQAASAFGLSLGNLTPDLARRLRIPDRREGTLVTDVDPSGPAARAGIQPRDVILEINRRPIASANEAIDALKAIPSGRTASFLVWRGNAEVFVIVRKD